MNCYYSNLIEGHNTTPRDIERAMANQLNASESRRNLQIEARAHIRVQRDIDRRHAAGELPEPASAAFIRELHREFYADAPEVMLLVGEGARQVRMSPGSFRSEADHEVMVGRHLPPSASAVEAFMAHFASRYRFAPLRSGTRILAIAAAHHRLNYIHPFLDGNGRVSRLMSHAMALEAGIGAHGLWSVSRGLARGLESRGDYRRMMDYARARLTRCPCEGRHPRFGHPQRTRLDAFSARCGGNSLSGSGASNLGFTLAVGRVIAVGQLGLRLGDRPPGGHRLNQLGPAGQPGSSDLSIAAVDAVPLPWRVSARA